MIKIRKAIKKDALSIIEFQQKMAWETEGLILVPGVISDGVNAVFSDQSKGEYWVAENEEEVVASLMITYEWSDWRNSVAWWIQSVYVLPEFRRTGIFRSMYEHIRLEAEKNGAAGLRLYVEVNNTRAQKTYDSLGMIGNHYKMYEWMIK